MSARFLKFIPSDEAFWLMDNKMTAFRLLSRIANAARRTNDNPEGLLIGQCHLQHWSKYNLTEREYRTAKSILVQRKHIIIIETCRTRQKSTTGTTTGSTLVQIISSTVYDINKELNDDRIDDRATTDRRHNKKYKKEEEEKEYKESEASGPSDFASDPMLKAFLEGLKKRMPNTKLPSNLKAWAEELGRMQRLDGRSEADMLEAIAWMEDAKWYKYNILSPDSFRKHFDRMQGQMAHERETLRQEKNRQWALAMKSENPAELKNLTFNAKYVCNPANSKEIPFDLPEQTFQEAFAGMFGGNLCV